MLKPLFLALSMMLVTPLAVQAAEITLIPAVKLQIGDRDDRGQYWNGGHWRDHGWWQKHYDWRENHWQPRDGHQNRHDDRRPEPDRGPGPEMRHR